MKSAHTVMHWRFLIGRHRISTLNETSEFNRALAQSQHWVGFKLHKQCHGRAADAIVSMSLALQGEFTLSTGFLQHSAQQKRQCRQAHMQLRQSSCS